MPVIGSTITIDLHVTEDSDLDSLHAVARRNERVHPDLAETIREAVEQKAKSPLESNSVGDYDLSVDVGLVTERVPGAPRERITTEVDVEGEDHVVAAVDDAVSAPQRAQIADSVEAEVVSYLGENGLSNGIDVIVSVTPIEFR
jgi:hypothetical protein